VAGRIPAGPNYFPFVAFFQNFICVCTNGNLKIQSHEKRYSFHGCSSWVIGLPSSPMD
jgi:hypothetical protein